MKTIKLMQVICIMCAILSISCIDKHPDCFVPLLFSLIALGLFSSAESDELKNQKKIQEMNNDLYERSNN